MNHIDLHVHSNISDGTLTPTEVVELAAEIGLIAIALTDHDTVAGVDEALRAAQKLALTGKKIRVIAGTELSAGYKNIDIHILGLFINHKDKDLLAAMEGAIAERELRNIKMCHNLMSAGIDISVEKMRQTDGNAVLTRAHFAKYLTQHGYTKTPKLAFQKYLDASGPYYVPRQYLSPKEAIALILSAGGIPVLAHPLLYKLPKEELDLLIGNLKSYGLVGIETIYSSNTGFEESDVRKLARKHNLLITGGSDFHGANKPLIQLGTGKGNLVIPETVLEDLDAYKKDHAH